MYNCVSGTLVSFNRHDEDEYSKCDLKQLAAIALVPQLATHGQRYQCYGIKFPATNVDFPPCYRVLLFPEAKRTQQSNKYRYSDAHTRQRYAQGV